MAAASPPGEHQVSSWFESYLRVANRHTFDELRHFLDPDLTANGRPGRQAYLDQLRTVARGWPDFRQTLQHLVISPEGWLGARFRTSGTHLGTFRGLRATGTRLSLDEVAYYRVTDFMITEIRSTLDEAQLVTQIQSGAR